MEGSKPQAAESHNEPAHTCPQLSSVYSPKTSSCEKRNALKTSTAQKQTSGRPSRASSKGHGSQLPRKGSATPSAIMSIADRPISLPPKRPVHATDQVCGEQSREVNVAIVGCSGVGKSTFVQCALDLKHASASPISSKKVSLEGSISVVHLLELDLADVHADLDSYRWPETVEEYTLPAVDGFFLLFDIMNIKTFEKVAKALSMFALHRTGILGRPTYTADIPTRGVDFFDRDSVPAILVASKCDMPQKGWQVTTEMVDNLTRHKNVELFQTALCSPETHKRCISIMLRNVMLQRHGPPSSGHTTHPCINHSRATSETLNSVARDFSTKPVRASDPLIRPHPPTGLSYLTREPISFVNDVSEGQLFLQHECRSDDPQTEEVSLKHGSLCGEGQGKHTATQNNSNAGKVESGERGVTFEALTDRLVAMPMSKQDYKFIETFLCLYRNFAAPLQLLTEIIRRFGCLDQEDLADTVKSATRMRYLSTLQKWISEYACDFAPANVRRLLTDFVTNLATEPEFAVTNKKITFYLDAMGDDGEDMECHCSEKSRSRACTIESFLSTTSSKQTATSTVTAELANQLESPSGPTPRHSATPCMHSTLSSRSTGPLRSSVDPREEARHCAKLLRPFSRYNLDKTRWHRLIDLPDDQIASELTRIDWILYSSIRPRDLARHIMVNPDAKERCKSLEYVSGMINQFNHIAFWVANMILLRDKPKHRALMLNKFLGVAWKLRYLNNYNSLGAVIAGINGTPVHRLSQTRALVSPDARKQFMRLEILMGTAKSHSAYRLGWQNTSGPRIPFLPLHRRDLLSAEAGNKTFISTSEGQTINWKKFEIMGDILVGIRESQGLPYPPIMKNDEISHLLLGCRLIKDEDELYERSVQLEKPGVGEATRKKFSLFQR